MEPLNARPRLLKQANLSLIRKVIKTRGAATRAEVAEETKISSTTVRSLLAELMQNGEIESAGLDESSGGRKAERYRLNPDRYYSAAFCITSRQVHSLLVNVCGDILETTLLDVPDGNQEQAICSCLDSLISRKEIKAIGIGVPGIVDGGRYWKQDPQTYELYQEDIGERLAGKYGLPVLLENDVNATAIGFGLCYQKEFPLENPADTNMAYLHFEDGCVSGGFLAGGRIIRGCSNFAGELGLIPMEQGKTLDEYLGEPMDNAAYTQVVIKIIGWICGILNPKYIALGGPALRKDCISMISDGLYAYLPKHMQPEILHSPDMWSDYYEGLASLTAGKMFDGIQFIKE